MLVREMMERRLPGCSQAFCLELLPAAGGEAYEIDGDGAQVVLRGSSQLTLAMAFYRYLRDFCAAELSWCGDRELRAEGPFPIPERVIRVEITQKRRVYFNYCTLSYSAAWWDWARWEKELDFMAMNGINMPLCVVGTEAVWYETLLGLGLTREEALSYLSGPSHWAWQLMTNLDSFLPPPDVSYIYDRLRLGQKIIRRAVAWGMTPIQQGFSGHVPGLFLKKFPEARITKTASWCGFPQTHQLDPLDPLFERVGLAFLRRQKELLGASHYYACDPFHENEPSSRAPGYLKRVGRAIDRLYHTFDPQAVWVMQSWSLRRKIVRAVPKERLLILCINGQRRKGRRQFWGYPFVLGNLMNYGGKNSLHGELALLAANPYARLRRGNPALYGTGLFMEGINQNPLYYDLALAQLTASAPCALADWLEGYARRRYHSTSPAVRSALALLAQTCYGPGREDAEAGSIICARPDFYTVCAAPNDRIAVRYDNRALYQAALALLDCPDAPTDGWLFDVCDVTRQVLSNHVLSLYRAAMDAFQAREKARFAEAAAAMLTLILELDGLLLTREELTLHAWLEEARACAHTQADRGYFEKSARLLLTLWGPPEQPLIFDYAWREWGGLLASYYHERWARFFAWAKQNFDTLPRSRPASMKTAYQRPVFEADAFYQSLARFERDWIASQAGDVAARGDTAATARLLLEKYGSQIEAVQPESTGSKGNLDFWRK